MNNSSDKTLKIRYGEVSSAEAPLSERLEYLVGNSQHSDFTFIIEDDNVEIPAHKLILARASPVLERIVYGTASFPASDSTKVDGIANESFMEILRYIYTDKINFNDDNVFDILNKANYFGLAAIETKCFHYLKKHLSTESVAWIFHQLFYSFSSCNLLKDCLQFIRLEPLAFFATEEFPNVAVDAFKLILQMDAINCTEVDLFDAMIKLARAHCTLGGLEATGSNLRIVLDGAEKLLRLEALNRCEFDSCLAIQPDFFSSNEIAKISSDIDDFLPTVKRRKWFTYQDAVWLEVADPTELPPSCFYAGASLFICRSEKSENKTGILPQDFTPHSLASFAEHTQYLKIEVLCGSGYEWSKWNGEVPLGSVSVSESNAKPVFIARGRVENSGLHIGPVSLDGRMHISTYEPDDISLFSYDSEVIEAEHHELLEFEILVAKNVKNPYIGNDVPSDAIFIGYNENNFKTYLGRAWYRNDLLPAKVIIEHGTAFVSHGMEEITVPEFEFVRMDPGTYKWEEGMNGKVPAGAFDGGCTISGETLYFGRVLHNGIYIPGKVHPSHKVFYAPYRGQELNFRSYEVLVRVKEEEN